MDNAVTRAVFDRSPPFVRSIGASVFGWSKRRRRFTGDYSRWQQLFVDAEFWPMDRVVEHQSECLRRLVKHAGAHVPYYRALFQQSGIDPAEINGPDDLSKLPILEKADVVAAGDDLISDLWRTRKLNRFPTSGSTGTPLVVPHTESIEQMEWAFLHNRFLPRGTEGRPYSTFTGLELLPPGRSKPPFWVDNWPARQRMFSIFHMSDKTLDAYVDALESRYSLFYWGYPSAITTIADHMSKTGRRLRRPPEYILGASEEMQPRYEQTLREVFGARILNRYGQNELVASITKYECGHLHCDLDYSIIELLEVERLEGGEVLSEVIGTNMHDLAWPLLRYRTGDLVVHHPDDECDCGRPGRVIRRIHGRTGRSFTLPDGSRVSNISVIAKKCTNVRLMQVVQKRLGEIIVRVVRDSGYSVADEERVILEFRKKLGDEVLIDIEYVGDIERTRGGKFMSIVDEVGSGG